MNIGQSQPLSPSMSPALASTLTPGSTQAPTFIRDSLPGHGISIEDADAWNRKYNRASLPLMHDDQFWGLLVSLARDTDPVDGKFETTLKGVMEEKSTRSQNEFNNQTYEIMSPGAALFENESHKLIFLSLLDEKHTVHNLEAFVTHCLPALISLAQKRKSGRRQRSMANTKGKKPASKRFSTSSSESAVEIGRRRSSRINKLNTPPGST